MLIYDGDCGFCTRCASWLAQRLPTGIPVVAWQELPSLEALGLTEAEVRTAAYFIDTSGHAWRGEAAIARSLIVCGGGWAMLGWALALPPLRWLAAPAYRLVARNRSKISRSECRTREAPAARRAR